MNFPEQGPLGPDQPLADTSAIFIILVFPEFFWNRVKDVFCKKKTLFFQYCYIGRVREKDWSIENNFPRI